MIQRRIVKKKHMVTEVMRILLQKGAYKFKQRDSMLVIEPFRGNTAHDG